MPLNRLVLIIVSVMAAAGATIWLATRILANAQLPPPVGISVLSLIALCAWFSCRVISVRINKKG